MTEEYKPNFNIFKENLQEIYRQNPLLEMATDRQMYGAYCLSMNTPVFTHIGKICLLEDNPKFKQYVDHWKDEIVNMVYDLVTTNLKDDRKDCRRRKKAFIDSFIEGHLGDNYSDYSFMYYCFEKALEDEGFTKDEIRKIDPKQVAKDQKNRVVGFLNALIPICLIKNKEEAREALIKTVDRFF